LEKIRSRIFYRKVKEAGLPTGNYLLKEFDMPLVSTTPMGELLKSASAKPSIFSYFFKRLLALLKIKNKTPVRSNIDRLLSILMAIYSEVL
jgi:hypothetical protein